MKILNINFRYLTGLLLASLLIFAQSCTEEKTFGPFAVEDLDVVIVEAQELLNNSEEGTFPGEYKPGSLKELQDAVTWAIWKKDNSKEQNDIALAAIRLRKYIDRFKANIVTLSTPWIQQENDTYIHVSDNVKTVLDKAWTIEIKCYIIDLNNKGWSNNLFSAEQSGPDSGFGVRYFSDGNIQIVVGNNNWVDSKDQAGAGTMKAGEWMDVALSNSGTKQILYVNGVKVAEIENTHLLSVDKSFVIGNSPMWTDRVCNTLVKDFRLWNSVLDASTIQTNISATFDGTESGLECYFPLNADLGSEFKDVTGKYTATLQGNVEWVDAPPVIVLDYTKIREAITKISSFKTTVTEGENDGDYPLGTLAYIDEIIADGNDKITNETRQSELDDFATKVDNQIALINSMLVGEADGIFIERDNPDAVGLRITPNYTPQGDYTVEFDVQVKSLNGYGTGEFFNNGEYGIWVYGYEEVSEESILASGGLWNFTNAGDGWQGPKTEPLIIKKDTWQNVAIVHDNTARTTKIFVDGVEKASYDSIGAPVVSGWGEMWLGNGWGKMDGYIRDFRLWDEARLTQDLGADITGSENNLKVYLPLDRVKGVKFQDETGNFNAEMRGIEWN